MIDSPEPIPPVGRYHIETWGCQMNELDADKLAGALEQGGYVPALRPEQADVILFNTCSIREKAAEKVFSELGRYRPLKASNPGLILGVCGCVAQQEGREIFRRAPYVDFVIGPRATSSLPELVSRIRAGDESARHTVDIEYRSDSILFPFDAIRREGLGNGKAFVTVIEGCNHRCTYCVVPTTRGKEVCRSMGDVMQEVESLVSRGVSEIEFLGQTVNAYRDAEGHDLADLLRASSEVDGVQRIRFTTSHPAQMTERLMNAMASAQPAVCPYLHLPAQSGSSKVLRDMRRGYDREGYLRKIEGLKRRMPEMMFGTDLIVGFPTETDADHRETLSLLDEVQFDTVYSFTYSERPGTAALRYEDPLAPRVKVERLQELQDHQKGIQERRNLDWIGRAVEVRVEGRSKRDSTKWTGRTPGNRIVHFSGAAKSGTMERVRITNSTAYSLQAVPVEETA